ncbi:MAG: NAD(P)/FAD-dependent oxidoreductase, partial [Clostridia bacterium]|nr:NAD(P)/FAD-dependent oxidoreductase [Clostridia bacterium]
MKAVIIGGGASGMMCGIFLAKGGVETTILEKNEKLGKKVYITGKGRCNVTNDCDVETLFQNVVTNSKFLYSAFYTFDNSRMKALLEEEGCKLKVERGERVFPVSDHASDVNGALKRKMNRLGATVRLNTGVKELIVEERMSPSDAKDSVIEIRGVVLDNGKREYADAVVVAGGGYSYPTTGSDGSI